MNMTTLPIILVIFLALRAVILKVQVCTLGRRLVEVGVVKKQTTIDRKGLNISIER